MSLLLISRRQIFERRSRSMLTILGIAMGVATIIALMSIGIGTKESISSSLDKILGAGFIVIPQGKSVLSSGGIIDVKVVDSIERIPGVKVASPILMITVYTHGSFPTQIYGVEITQTEDISNVDLADGRDWVKGEERKANCVVGSDIASDLNLELGDIFTVSLDPSFKNEIKLKVIGICKPTGFADQDRVIYLPIEKVQDLAGEPGKATMILVKLKDNDRSEAVKREIEHRFRDLKVIKKESLMENINQILRIVNGVLFGLAAISIIVGALGVMNTITTSVLERTRQIGILKAIGADQRKILMMFLAETIFLGLIGGFLGCLGGTIMTKLATVMMDRLGFGNLPYKFVPSTFALGMSMSLLVSVLAGIYPAFRASNLRTVEALHYE